ncbi:MAG: 6-bladed beta-propeller [Gemmatimonas sp.]
MTSFRFGFASRLLLQSFAAGTALTLSLSTVAFAQPWRAVPGVRIRAVAAADTTAEVGDIASAVQLSGGTIVIADNINYQLHFYSAAGRFLRTIARRGEGPGEFKSVRWVGECSRDTVFAYDHMLNRITVFGTDGKVIRSFAPAVPQTGYVRCLLDGTTLYVARSAMSELSSRGVLQVSDKAGKLLYRSPEMLLDDGRPLGTSMKIAIAPEGFVYGSGDSARVMMMSLHGESPHRISAGIADRAPTDVNRDAAVEYWATFIKGTEYDYERMRGLFRKLPPVKTLPAYTDVFADVVTKAIWVRTSTFGDPSTLLERHAMDGTLQGTATLPPGLEIQQIRGDVVLAVAKDSKTGEQLLVTYRLVK